MIVRFDHIVSSIHNTNAPSIHTMGYQLIDRVDRVKEEVTTFTSPEALELFREGTCGATNFEWVSYDHDHGALQAFANRNMSPEEASAGIEVSVLRLTRSGDTCDTIIVTSHGGYIMSDQGKTIQKF